MSAHALTADDIRELTRRAIADAMQSARETCDWCGERFAVREIEICGTQFLCPRCRHDDYAYPTRNP